MKTTLLFLSVFLSATLFGQNVYIPDANFKTYLVGNPQINTNGDNEIQVSEATAFDGEINCYGLNIADVTGIEAFTSLTNLNMAYNLLTDIDISQNSALEVLDCFNNLLISLNLNGADALTELNCRDNQLTNLDVSQNIALEDLDCSGNQLTTLDVTQNNALVIFLCYSNQLTSLNVSQNIALGNLTCEENQLTSLDVSQNTSLFLLWCSGNQLTSLDVSQNTILGVLDCSYNQLTVLDVSANTELYELEFESTQVQSIDLSQNTDLWWLACGDSPLVSLDISNSNSLEFLYAGGNQLNCLNAKNGNNGYITDFMVYSSPNLTCIEVDDAEWSTDNWTFIDPQMYFSEDCNYPDNCDDSSVGINALSHTSKKLIQILDMMGRETSFKHNTPLIYVYDNGSIEKVFSVEY